MRYFITLFFYFLLCFQTFAQEKTSLFLLLGSGLTSERGEVSPGTNYTKKLKIGYSFGLGVTHSFNKHFSIDGRLLSEAKGWNGKTEYDSISYDPNPTYHYLYSKEANVSVSYVTLSIIPKYVYKRFNAGVGAFIGTAYSSDTHLKYFNLPSYLQPPPGGQLATYYKSLYDFNKLDAGLVFTVGYALPIKDFLFTIQLVNNFGMSNVFRPNHGLPNFPVLPDTPSLHTNTYLLMIGVGHKKVNRKYFGNQTQ